MLPPYVRAPLPPLDDLAESYHENTKVRAYERDATDDPTAAGLELPPVASLVYSADDRRPLPAPVPLRDGLSRTIGARRTVRTMSGASVTASDVSTLLAHTYGGTGDGRAAPSAGARYPLELFVIARRVEGLDEGVWHYRPGSHELEPWAAPDAWARASRALFDQPFLQDAAYLLVFGAVFGRTCVKYGERGYRLVLLDAGHAAQNALLTACAQGCAAVPLGGFVDDELNAIVGLDGIGENVVYAIAIGRPAQVE